MFHVEHLWRTRRPAPVSPNPSPMFHVEHLRRSGRPTRTSPNPPPMFHVEHRATKGEGYKDGVRSFASMLDGELAALAASDRLRACTPLGGASRVHPTEGDVSRPALLSFASNDYLGLASHPALAAAAMEAIPSEGVGASASRLVTGDLPAHRRLEAGLASFVGRPRALLFPTGYQTNVGVVTALAGPAD